MCVCSDCCLIFPALDRGAAVCAAFIGAAFIRGAFVLAGCVGERIGFLIAAFKLLCFK